MLLCISVVWSCVCLLLFDLQSFRLDQNQFIAMGSCGLEKSIESEPWVGMVGLLEHIALSIML